MTTVAIMQPYLFPYVGYYQLVAEADTFVFLDDVTFIKRHFINRNYVRGPDQTLIRFTIPVLDLSQNRLINDHDYVTDARKPFRTISQRYSSSRNYEQVIAAVRKTLFNPSRSVSAVNALSVVQLCELLGMKRSFAFSSDVPNPDGLTGSRRIVQICRYYSGEIYINPSGGRHLYRHEDFNAQGLELRFLEPDHEMIDACSSGGSLFTFLDIMFRLPFAQARDSLIMYSLT